MAYSKDISSLSIRLCGETIPLKGNSSEDQARLAVELAQIKIDEISARSDSLRAQQVLLIALLEVAEEYVKSKSRVQEYRRGFREKSEKLIQAIESELK